MGYTSVCFCGQGSNAAIHSMQVTSPGKCRVDKRSGTALPLLFILTFQLCRTGQLLWLMGATSFGYRTQPTVHVWGIMTKQVKCKKENQREERVFWGDQTGGFNYRQLKSGHYVGVAYDGYYTTCQKFLPGVTPERFKYEAFTKATPEEIKEYNSLKT